MNQECQELRVKILDQSNKEIMLEIKLSIEEMKEMRQTMDCLGTEHLEVTENLRGLQDSHSSLKIEHSIVRNNLRELQTENLKVNENLKELQDSHSSLLSEHSEVTELLKDPIPRNIRGICSVQI